MIDPRGPGIGIRFMSMAADAQREWEHLLPRKGGKVSGAEHVPSYVDGMVTSVTIDDSQIGGLAIDPMTGRPRLMPLSKGGAIAMGGSGAMAPQPANGNGTTRAKMAAEIKEIVSTRVRRARNHAPRKPVPRPWAKKSPSEQPAKPIESKQPAENRAIKKKTVQQAPATAQSSTSKPKPFKPLPDNPADERWLVLAYRPQDVAKLRAFVDDCLSEGEANIPTAQQASEGDAFALVIHHPTNKTAQLRIFGRVVGVLGGQQPSIEVRFIKTDLGGMDAIDRFIGDKDVAAEKQRRHNETLSKLRQTAGGAPSNAAAQVELAWFQLLEDGDTAAAIETFLSAIALAPSDADAYYGLSLACGLSGDAEQARIFARSARRFAGR